MLSSLLFLPVVSAGTVREWGETYCALSNDALRATDADAYNKLGELFTEKIDCASTPGNRDRGFDLKGATFAECTKAAGYYSAAYEQSGTLDSVSCDVVAADEETGQVSIRFKAAATGKFGDNFDGYSSVIAKVEHGKGTGYLALLDPTNWLATPVKDWAEEFCSIFENSFKLSSREEGQAVEKKMASLFASSLDCSSDPNNPVVGFNLKGVSAEECVAETNKQKQLQWGSAKCIDIIADEKAGTGVVFLDNGNTGKYADKFHVRSAFRFKLEGGVLTQYHEVYDSYHVLPGTVQLAETSSAPMLAGALGFIAFAFVAGMTLSNRKKVPLLENEVVA